MMGPLEQIKIRDSLPRSQHWLRTVLWSDQMFVAGVAASKILSLPNVTNRIERPYPEWPHHM